MALRSRALGGALLAWLAATPARGEEPPVRFEGGGARVILAPVSGRAERAAERGAAPRSRSGQTGAPSPPAARPAPRAHAEPEVPPSPVEPPRPAAGRAPLEPPRPDGRAAPEPRPNGPAASEPPRPAAGRAPLEPPRPDGRAAPERDASGAGASRSSLKVSPSAGGLEAAPPRPLGPDEAAAPPALEAARAKEAAVGALAAVKSELARVQALAAYRLARRRGLEAFAPPATRLARAQAVNLAARALGRSAAEATLLREEVARLRESRLALERAAAAQSEARAAGADADETVRPALPRAARSPVLGALVGMAGARKDPATGLMLMRPGVQVLARFEAPARAPLPGVVAGIAPGPDGGYTVVLAHEGRWVSVTGGLRAVTVAPGARLDAGTEFGLVGRTLDGAPVVTFELWHAGVPIDPSPLFREAPEGGTLGGSPAAAASGRTAREGGGAASPAGPPAARPPARSSEETAP